MVANTPFLLTGPLSYDLAGGLMAGDSRTKKSVCELMKTSAYFIGTYKLMMFVPSYWACCLAWMLIILRGHSWRLSVP